MEKPLNDVKSPAPCGLYTFFGFLLPFAERLKRIRDAGFSSVCTWWGDTFAETDGDKRTHPALAARHGLVLEHAHLPYFGCDALWRNGLAGDALTEGYTDAILAAAESGVATLVFHPFEKRVPEGGDWRVFSARIRKLSNLCAQKNVRLAIENLADREGLCKILDSLSDNPAVGLCFDSGHANLVARNDFSLLTRYADRVFALHLHDNDGVSDQHLLPYLGSIDWARLLSALDQTAYHGSFMLEAGYPFDYDAAEADAGYVEPPIPADAFLADAMRACRRALAARDAG